MPTFPSRVKFAWDYFVRGCHRILTSAPASVAAFDPVAFRASLDIHRDFLVGEYVRTKVGTWWADTPVGGLSYSVRVIAPGGDPTEGQMLSFAELVQRIPKLIEDAGLEDAPQDDGWGHRPPPFDIRTARLSSIVVGADGGFFVIFEVDASDTYMLAPAFTISPTYTLISTEWSV